MNFVDCLLGDSTAVVDCSFYSSTRVEKGKVYTFKNMSARQNRDQLWVNWSRFAQVKEVDTDVGEVNMKVNISRRAVS